MPAEWAPHDAIWLAWPYDPTTFPDRVPQAEEAYLKIIEAIYLSEPVQLLVRDETVRQRVGGLLTERGVPASRVTFQVLEYADVWIRDYGPTFVVNPAQRKLAMVHWVFNAWGDKYEELLRDGEIPEKINVRLQLPYFEAPLVMEGGSIEVNGAGTVMTTEQCLLNKNRNSPLSRVAIEEYLREYLGVSQVVWLGEGIVGDDTDGHIDDIARFVDPRIIVCAREDDPQDGNFKLLEDNWRRLQSARDQDGQPFIVVNMPMPGYVGDAQGRLPASYTNFYIGNTVVLLPVFGHANDETARAILQGLFPTRKVVPIDARDLVYGLGTIHCMSQQQPKVSQ